jgi:hypothetical protein
MINATPSAAMTVIASKPGVSGFGGTPFPSSSPHDSLMDWEGVACFIKKLSPKNDLPGFLGFNA